MELLHLHFNCLLKLVGRLKVLYLDMIEAAYVYQKGYLTEASFVVHYGLLSVYDNFAFLHQIQPANET